MTETDPLQVVLAELTTANASLGRALADGDLQQVAPLSRTIAGLEQERDRLLTALDKPAAAYRPSLSARDRVVQLLRLTGVPTGNRILADLSRAQFREPLDTAGLSTLRRDESRVWAAAMQHRSSTAETTSATARGSDPGGQEFKLERVFVVPALSHDRFTAVRGTLALSEWPVERRIVAPASLRVDLLRAAVAVTNRAMEAGQESPLLRVVTTLAAGLGVATFRREPADVFADVLATCRDELEVIEVADARERAAAAERAQAQLDEQALLFGTQLAPLTSRGVQRVRPRKSQAVS